MMGKRTQVAVWILLSCFKYETSTQVVSGNYFNPISLERTAKILINDLQWKTVTLIHGEIEVNSVPRSVKQQRYNIDSIDLLTVLRSVHVLSFPDINIIIAVNDTWTQKIVEQIDRYDFISNGTTDYRHHSKILLLISSISQVSLIQQKVQHLENVAVAIVDNDTSNVMEMYSLLIHPTGSEFSFLSLTENRSLVNRMFPNMKYGYNNRRLLVSTLQQVPMVMKNIKDGSVSYSGYFFDVWKLVCKRLNISYDVIEPEDKEWGILQDGQWSGIVRQLINKEVHLAVSDMTVYYERAQSIDYVFPSIITDTPDIIYRRQPSSSNTFSLLVGPLKNEVYVAYFATFVVTVIVFCIIEHLRCFNTNVTTRVQCAELSSKVMKIVWQFVGTIFKQEFKIRPATSAGAVLLSSWCFLVLLITSLYCAHLIASLSSKTELSKFSSISELVDSDYTVSQHGSGVVTELLQKSNRPELRRLHTKKLTFRKHHRDTVNLLRDIDDHVQLVKNGKHAFVIYRRTAEVYMAEDCSLSLIGETITWAEEHLTLALPQGSPLKFDLEKVVYNLKESGVLDVLWKKWTVGINASTCAVSRQATSITMREVTGGFLVLCGGLGLSFLVLMVEICQHCKIRSKI